MISKFTQKLTRAILVLSTTSLFSSFAIAEETLRLSYFGGPQGTTYAKAIKPWVEAINADGEGVLKIDAFPGGALVGNPRGQVKALTDGVADIAFVVFSYTPGRFPDNGVLELPTLYENVHESSGVIRALYNEGMLGGFDDFYVPMIVTTFPYNFHTKEPVGSIADLKGLKIRAGGPVAGAALEALGAVPVGMPAPAIAENISKGVIDGAATDWSVLYSFRIDQVAPNHYMQLFSTVPIGLMMTKKRFAALTPEAQALIEKYSEKWIEDAYKTSTHEAQESFIAKNKSTDGHVIVYPTDEDKAAYDTIMNDVVQQWIKGGDGRAETLEFVRTELDRIRSSK
ncbi:MAG: TRAP transporter substrate-binding protein [Granulosicoccus sp.]|nr:TRAP transporter substrate-binding protein [Granulosicoccus sp.]